MPEWTIKDLREKIADLPDTHRVIVPKGKYGAADATFVEEVVAAPDADDLIFEGEAVDFEPNAILIK